MASPGTGNPPKCTGRAGAMAAACIVGVFFYRRALWAGIFLTFMVSLARVYSGVHFPSDTIIGICLAGVYTPALLWGAERLWRWKAPALFPDFAAHMPSLLD